MKHRVMRAELRAWVATRPLACVGEWNSADPLFVKLTFSEGGKDVAWEVPREGLLTGMEMRPGGDMGIRRDLVHDLVLVTLHGHGEDGKDIVAEISLTALPLDGWLEATDAVVPIGGELLAVDWDLLTRHFEMPDIPEADAPGGLCRACLPGSESFKYLDMVNAPACPLCGRKLR